MTLCRQFGCLLGLYGQFSTNFRQYTNLYYFISFLISDVRQHLYALPTYCLFFVDVDSFDSCCCTKNNNIPTATDVVQKFPDGKLHKFTR